MKIHDLGANIKQLRKDHSLTQQQLASRCGISRATLGRLENGNGTSVSICVLDMILASFDHEIEFKRRYNMGITPLDEIER